MRITRETALVATSVEATPERRRLVGIGRVARTAFPCPRPRPQGTETLPRGLAVDGVEARVAAETLAQRVGTNRRANSRAVFFVVVVVERARSFFLRRLSRRFLGRASRR